MAERLVKWFLFSVLVALLPLAFAWANSWMTASPKAYSDVVGRGELFIVGAALSAAAIGELIGKAQGTVRLSLFAYLAGGSSVIILTMCSLFYAGASAQGGADAVAVSLVSSLFYIFAVVVGGASILLGDK